MSYATAMRLARSDVDGLLPFTFDWFQLAGNLTVEYYAVKLPADLATYSDTTYKVLAREPGDQPLARVEPPHNLRG